MDNWEERRKEILKRDNYTCQECGNFNPELGIVELTDKDGGIELHNYDWNNGTYMLSHSRTGYSFNYDFIGGWPVFPIMQVHHKRYIKGRIYWEYEDIDLITLCKKCHVKIHSNELIPIYSAEGYFIEEKKYIPKDPGSGRKHNYDEWNFVGKNSSGEYILPIIRSNMTVVILANEDKNNVIEEGKRAFDKLMNNYFHRYMEYYLKVKGL